MPPVDELPKDEESWKAWATAQQDWWKRRTAVQEEEFIRQNNLMYGGLIGIGVVMVQPFLTASAEVIDVAARISLIAFSISVPLLAALLMLNRHEAYSQRLVNTFLVQGAKSVALGSGFVGVVAGFWHILPAAGIAVLVSGFVGIFVHSSGYTRLELDQMAAEQKKEGEQPPEA
jgi:hypothetical protein